MTIELAKDLVIRHLCVLGFPETDVVIYENNFEVYTFWGLIELIKNNR